MKNETKKASIFAFAFTLLTLLVVSFPILNYFSLSLRFSQLSQQETMRQYAKEVETQIYAISPLEKLFLFPRSILYKSALFNEKGEMLFSLIEHPLPYFNGEFSQQGDSLFYKHPLQPNLLGASSLIVTKEFSYSQVIFDILVIIGVVLGGIFGISYFIIKSMLKPYHEASTRMNNFFDDVMHELKTPLGIMQLNIESLVDKYYDKRLFRSLAALSTLSTLYDDLEYLIKNKTITYTTEEVCFSTFLEERLSYFEALAGSKEIIFVSTIEPFLHVTINRIELQRIVDNNITNAIKYSHPKKQIDIHLESRDGSIKLSIKDEGIGIKEVSKIFERHYRGDIFKGGFGIGLSIVKSICEKYGVKIEVNSKESVGSEFIYTFKKEEKISSFTS